MCISVCIGVHWVEVKSPNTGGAALARSVRELLCRRWRTMDATPTAVRSLDGLALTPVQSGPRPAARRARWRNRRQPLGRPPPSRPALFAPAGFLENFYRPGPDCMLACWLAGCCCCCCNPPPSPPSALLPSSAQRRSEPSTLHHPTPRPPRQ